MAGDTFLYRLIYIDGPDRYAGDCLFASPRAAVMHALKHGMLGWGYEVRDGGGAVVSEGWVDSDTQPFFRVVQVDGFNRHSDGRPFVFLSGAVKHAVEQILRTGKAGKYYIENEERDCVAEGMVKGPPVPDAPRNEEKGNDGTD